MTKKILVVEDEPASLNILRYFLSHEGYEIAGVKDGLEAMELAEDGEKALSLLASMQIDVVISDLKLPGNLNGRDILGALKTLPRKIDAILMSTGTGSDDVRRRAKSLGAAYMEKPAQLRELEQTIQQRARR